MGEPSQSAWANFLPSFCARRRPVEPITEQQWAPPACLSKTNFGPPRFKKSCYFDATVRYGVKGFTSYNHYLLPIVHSSPEEEYWNLKKNVCLWDVSCERQVEISGPDAVELAELMTPRAMGSMKVGDCRYAILTDEKGNVINDPLALRVAEDKFWFSIADTDIHLWAKGLALGRGFDVKICDPKVSPLAVQGPKSLMLMKDVFGEWVGDLKQFKFQQTHLDGVPMIVARSGWSPELGYEIYLQDETFGDKLWEIMMAAGQKYNITPGCPNHLRRMEGGMISFGSDCTMETNVMELGLPPAWSGPGKKANFLAKEALLRLVAEGGPKRQMLGLKFTGTGETTKAPALHIRWKVSNNKGDFVGEVSSCVFSPTLNADIAIALLWDDAREPGTRVIVATPDGRNREAHVCTLPFLPRADKGI